MRVDLGGDAVGRPTCVGNADLGDEGFVHVSLGFVDQFPKTSDLSDLLVEDNLSFLITIDADA